MPNRPQNQFLAASLAITVVLMCALTVASQSGRRLPRSTPVPASTPEPISSPKKPSEPAKPALTLIVGIDRFDNFANIPFGVYDDVLRSCVDRLNDSTAVKVEVAQSGMNRAEAVNRAKAEKEAHVVWLQVRSDSFTANNRTSSNLDYVFIEYSVFAPTTAKSVAFGRTYPQANRNRGVIINSPSRGPYSDYRLVEAAREAAERILADLAHPLPRKTLPLPLVSRGLFRVVVKPIY